MHDAVLETETSIAETLGDQDGPKVAVMACAEDARRRQVEERWALIDYAEMCIRDSWETSVLICCFVVK